MSNQRGSDPNRGFLIEVLGIGGMPREEDNIPWLVENILADLTEEEVEHMKLKFGLAGNYVYDDEEIAIILRKPEEQIRAMEKATIAKIKDSRKKGKS